MGFPHITTPTMSELGNDVIYQVLAIRLEDILLSCDGDIKIAPGMRLCNRITDMNQLKTICKSAHEYIVGWGKRNDICLNHRDAECICSIRDKLVIGYDLDDHDGDYEAWCEISFRRHQNVCRVTVSCVQYEVPEIFTCCTSTFTLVNGVYDSEMVRRIDHPNEPCRDHPDVRDLMQFIELPVASPDGKYELCTGTRFQYHR